MVLNTEPIRQVIEIDVDKNSATKSIDFARDTGKKIDKELQRKLQIDILQAEAKVERIKQQIREAKKAGEQPFALQLDLKNVNSGLTEAKRQLNNLNNTGETAVSRLQAKFNGLGQSIGGAFTKIGATIAALGVGTFFRNVINEAVEAERATAQLNAVLKSTGGMVGLSAKEIQSMAVELGKLNGVDNDVIASAQNMLLTFTNIKGKAFEPATQAIIDLATAMNGGLTPSSEELSKTAVQVGKALNDPIRGVGALSKVGVTFNEVQREQIKNFVETGNVAAAQQMIISELNKEFGGSAAAQLETYGGKLQSMNVAFGQLKETIGNVLIPILTQIIGFINPVIAAFQRFADENPRLTSFLGITTIAVVALTSALAILGGPISAVVAGVALLAGAGVGLTNSFNDVRREFELRNDGMKDLNGKPTALAKEIEALRKKGEDVKMAFNDATAAQQAYGNTKINQSATRAELQKTRAEAIATTKALIASLTALVAAANTSQQKAVREFQKVNAGITGIDLGLGATQERALKINTKELEKQQKILDDIEKGTFSIAKVPSFEEDVIKPVGGGGGSSKAKDALTDLEKEQKKVQGEQQKVRDEFEKTINTDNIKKATDALTNSGTYEDAIENIIELKDTFTDAGISGQEMGNELFKALDGAETKAKSSIATIKGEIEGLNKQIDNLGKSKDEKITSRVIDIDEEIAKLQQAQSEGTIDSDGEAKLIALAEERQKAFEGLSAEQITALNELITKQKEYDALNPIEKILADYALEKQTLDDKLLLKQAELDKENEKLLVFDKFKILLTQQQALIQDNAAFEIAIANQLIAKREAVARAKAAAGVAGGSVGAGTSTNTTTNAVNNNATTNSIVVNVNGPNTQGVVDAIQNGIT